MARVTIEDCLEKVEDRFELVALAAQRAKDIASGAELTMERKGEKDTVISLREIAEENIKVSDLKEEIIVAHQAEKNILEEFIMPANSNEDSISIDEEEADIKAAINEATESDIAGGEAEEELLASGTVADEAPEVLEEDSEEEITE